ncbi:MAG: choice-of-anchor D domain-containing protein [Verrucomicrobia bacterium]|nr:choice-of-anchor D domain-containing protein [Verrucomicrobiota bacterium]
MRKTTIIQILTGVSALALAAGVQAAALTFSAANFGDVSQLSTSGVLVDAAHFGADAEADVTVNGITFVSRGGSSPTLTVGGTAGASYYDANLYQAGTHTVGYTDIVGMSATDEELMFDSVVYGPGFGNSLVTLSGLIVGHSYRLELLLVRDHVAGNSTYLNNDPVGAFSGPYDWSNNAVQLVTSTFTADATTQKFRQYVGGDNNVNINAYQLRDVTPTNDPRLQVAATFSTTHDGSPLAISIPVSNLGAANNLEIASVTPGGADAAEFTVDSFTSPILPGGSGTIEVTFTPVGGGLHQANLTIASNDAANPSVDVSLQVNVLDPVASASPASINFGNLSPAPGPQTVSLFIDNLGSTFDLELNSLQITGPDAAIFSVGTYPATVAPAASAEVGITFQPGTEDGYFAASLAINTNDPAHPTITVPLSAAVELANPDASLRSHFTFDNAANVADDSGSFDNDGTVVGDAQRTTQSRVGAGALLLDGSGDLVDVGNGDDYTTQLVADGDGFTFACWAFIPNAATSGFTRFFSTYTPSAFVSEGWGVGTSSAQLIGTTYGKVDYLSSPAPARGVWHHFAYVFRNDPISRVDSYVDGALVASTGGTPTGLNPATTVGFAIGALGAPAATQYFNGRIDDLRIYDRELVAANIANLFNSAPPVSAYDAWASSFGLDPAGNGAPGADADGDGFTNLQEFLFGKDPEANDGTLTATERSGNTLIIRWKQLASGATYRLMESATLANPWTESAATVEPDGAQTGEYLPKKAQVTIGSGKNFFRVEGSEN